MAEAPSVSPHDLYARLGTARAPVLVDVRREQAFRSDERMIVGAIHRPPEDVETWHRPRSNEHLQQPSYPGW